MSARSRKVAFVTLAVIGMLVLAAGAGVEAYAAITNRTVELPHSVYLVGMLFGFVGFFALEPQRAKEGGTFIVDSVVRVVSVVRPGRRSSDRLPPVPAEFTAPVPPAEPQPRPAPPQD